MRKYCVVVMDNWTPVRWFWFRRNALRHARKHSRKRTSLYNKRSNGQWVEENYQ